MRLIQVRLRQLRQHNAMQTDAYSAVMRVFPNTTVVWTGMKPVSDVVWNRTYNLITETIMRTLGDKTIYHD